MLVFPLLLSYVTGATRFHFKQIETAFWRLLLFRLLADVSATYSNNTLTCNLPIDEQWAM